MAQDDHSGTDVAAADSSHAAHEFRRVARHGGHRRPTRSRTPGSRRTALASPMKTRSGTSGPNARVYTLFYLSILGSVWAIAAYMLFPIESNDVGDGPAEQHVRRPRRDPRPARHRLRRSALGQVAHGRGGASSTTRHPIGRATPRDAGGAVEVFTARPTRSPASPAARSSATASSARSSSSRCRRSCCSAASPRRTRSRSSSSATPCGPRARASRSTRRACRSRPPTSRIGSAFHVIPEGLAELEHGKLEEKAKAAVLLMRLEPSELNQAPDRESWSYDGHRRLLEDLHARRMPRRALRAAHPPPALPLPPVAVRRGEPLRGHLRPGQAPAAAVADRRRRRGLPRRAERLHRTRRPELLGAPVTTAPTRSDTTAEAHRSPRRRRTTSTTAPASRPRQGTRPQGLPRPLVVPPRRGRPLQLRRRAHLGHLPDVLLPGLDGRGASTTAPTCRSRASRCRSRWPRPSTSPSTSAAACSCARCTTGRPCCSSRRSDCTCCASSSPARSASRARSTGSSASCCSSSRWPRASPATRFPTTCSRATASASSTAWSRASP